MAGSMTRGASFPEYTKNVWKHTKCHFKKKKWPDRVSWINCCKVAQDICRVLVENLLNVRRQPRDWVNFFQFIVISWRLITLPYCSGFCHTLTWTSHGFTCIPHRNHPLPPPSPSHPSGSSHCTSPEQLFHASNLGWWSVSPLIIYMFRCCSLKTSHPCLPPQSPKVCSVHLCLFFCFSYRVIVTIFLNSIYMLVYCIGVYLSGLLHSV